MLRRPTRSGVAISPTFGRRVNGTILRLSWIYMRDELWAGRYQKSRMQIWWSRRWTWLVNNVENLMGCCFTPIKDPKANSTGRCNTLIEVFMGRPAGWMQKLTGQQAQRDISQYLMHYYNWIRPHQFNDGLAPAQAEKKLNVVSGIS